MLALLARLLAPVTGFVALAVGRSVAAQIS